MAFVTSPRIPTDPNGNPIGAAVAAAQQSQAPVQAPVAQAAPMPVQQDPTSQINPNGSIPRPSPYSPGSLFWLATGGQNAPTQEEYQLNLLNQQKSQLGAARQAAFSTLTDLVQQGNSPQKAFLLFMKTPQGANFISKDPDPQGAIAQFVKLATIDPKLAARQAAFGDGGGNAPAATSQPPAGGAGPGTDIFTAQPQSPTGAPSVAPQYQIATPVGAPQTTPDAGIATPVQPQAQPQLQYQGQTIPLANHQNGDWFRQRASVLAAGGDDEGARVALDMAKQYDDQLGKADAYDKYAADEQARGRTPMSRYDYTINTNRSNASQNNINTVEGVEAARSKALIGSDAETLKQTQQSALKAQQTLTTLQQASKYVDTPGGFAGQANAQLAKLGDLLGFKVTKDMGDAEALQAITAQMAAQFRPIGTGSTSDYEQKLFQSAVPGLSTSVTGRKKIIDINTRMAQRMIAYNKVLRNNLGDPNLDDKLSAVTDAPLLNNDDVKFLKANGGTDGNSGGNPTPSTGNGNGTQPVGGPLKAPDVGAIQQGYKFNGGDPANPKSWVKVQ